VLPRFCFTTGHAPSAPCQAPCQSKARLPSPKPQAPSAPAFLVGQPQCHKPLTAPPGHPMSHPAIYIALRCTTPHVPPRYTPPGSARPRPARPPRSPSTWCGIPDFPYAIRISEFGNPKSETGDSGNHGAVEWAIHPLPKRPRTPIRGFSFLSGPTPRIGYTVHFAIKRAPSPLSAPAIAILHPPPQPPTDTSQSVGGSSINAAAAGGVSPPKRSGDAFIDSLLREY
jgi:hypothetical protein